MPVPAYLNGEKMKRDPRQKIVKQVIEKRHVMPFLPSRDFLPDRNRFSDGCEVSPHFKPVKRWKKLFRRYHKTSYCWNF